MKVTMFAGATALAVLAFLPVAAIAEEPHVAPVTDYVNANVVPWMVDPVIVNAIKKQNAANESRSQADVESLDAQWRAEIDADSRPLIEKVMNSELSKFLDAKQQEAGGMLTEVFVMDNKGLNVGQSDVTSDYWQGDEAKWQNSFSANAGTVVVGEIENDESTQTLQTQASIPVADPATNEIIGVLTVGVDVSGL